MQKETPIIQTAMPPIPEVSPIVQKFSNPNARNLYMSLIGIFVIVAGVLTGFVLPPMGSYASSSAPAVKKVSANEVGISDDKTYKDNAQGILKDGGIQGEGMFHLERPGGDSQNVYLTSTAVDLASFVGKKVQVWGQTISGKKAGWLMDVGKVKIL